MKIKPDSLVDLLAMEFGLLTQTRLFLAVVFLVVGIWFWPEGALDVPVSMIALGDWLWIVAAALSWGFALLMVYFIAEHIYLLVRNPLLRAGRKS